MYSYDRSSARRRDYRQDVLELLKRGPKSIWTLTPDHLDAAKTLLKDGLIEHAGTGRDGRPLYQLTKRRTASELKVIWVVTDPNPFDTREPGELVHKIDNVRTLAAFLNMNRGLDPRLFADERSARQDAERRMQKRS